MSQKIELKFKHLEFAQMRQWMLKDHSKESYAIAMCKTEVSNQTSIIKVIEVRYPNDDDYDQQHHAYLEVSQNFPSVVLNEINQRMDLDTMIEIHTHPFMGGIPHFSHVDDQDEKRLSSWVHKEMGKVNYGSVLLSTDCYSFRMWYLHEQQFEKPIYGVIKTQTKNESIRGYQDNKRSNQSFILQDAIHHRSYLALGKHVISNLMSHEMITIVGLGGIGSIIAENLVHMGFMHLSLIDHDLSETSNLNRMVGLTYQDAENKCPKVEVVKKHLLAINPELNIRTYQEKIQEEAMKEVVASSDWVLLATDNHASRFYTQQLCFQYFVPFISVGVNIEVDADKIADMSGEVIVIRVGDHLCLKCMERLDFNEIAKDMSPDDIARKGLVDRGYVKGADVKEPAVKNLNAILGALTVDQLVNQYTRQHPFHPITVYEYNRFPIIYNDQTSMNNKVKPCSICDI